MGQNFNSQRTKARKMLYLHLFSFYSIFSGIFLNKDNLLAMLQVILKYLIDIFNRQKMVAQNIFLEILGRQVLRSQKKTRSFYFTACSNVMWKSPFNFLWGFSFYKILSCRLSDFQIGISCESCQISIAAMLIFFGHFSLLFECYAY